MGNLDGCPKVVGMYEDHGVFDGWTFECVSRVAVAKRRSNGSGGDVSQGLWVSGRLFCAREMYWWGGGLGDFSRGWRVPFH